MTLLREPDSDIETRGYVGKVAVYLRISHDPDGTSTATARQLRDCKSYAQLKGWKVAEVFEDVDISAYQENVVRPAYEELLERLRTGEFSGVLVWKLDRLVRRVAEFERFWKVCEGSGATLASFNESIDTGTEIGMLIVRILVAFAHMESANTSLRLRARERERAEAGRPKIAGRRPFGLTADWSGIVEPEAALIREAAQRVLAGEREISIIRDWHARGVPTPTGREIWQLRTLRNILISPRLRGDLEHRGAVVGPGSWPAILDRETSLRLARALTRPGGGEKTRRTSLLSGLLLCAKCGARMKVATNSLKGLKRYGCQARPWGCNGVSIGVDKTDEAVSEMVLLRLDSKEVHQMLKKRRGAKGASKDADVLGRLAEAEERLRDLDNQWARGELSPERHRSMSRQLEAYSEELRSELSVLRQAEPLERLDALGGGIRAIWDDIPTDRRRAIIDLLLERVEVRPIATRGSKTFDVTRLYPVWRQVG